MGLGGRHRVGSDLMTTGDQRRVKTCSDPTCSWMSYDNMINRAKHAALPSRVT